MLLDLSYFYAAIAAASLVFQVWADRYVDDEEEFDWAFAVVGAALWPVLLVLFVWLSGRES